jgi:hypothetical protein
MVNYNVQMTQEILRYQKQRAWDDTETNKGI